MLIYIICNRVRNIKNNYFISDPQFATLRAPDAGAKLKLLEVQKLEEEAKRVSIKLFVFNS